MKLDNLTNLILDEYEREPIKKDHCSCRLPANSEIGKIIQLSLELIFPGYFTKKEVSEYGSRPLLEKTLKKLHRLLKSQISLALLYLADQNKDSKIAERSCTLCYRFLEHLPKIRQLLHTDLEAAYQGDPSAFNRDQIVVSYPGFYAIAIHRIAHELLVLGVPLIPRMMSEYAHRHTGIDINPGAIIGKSFFIDHGTGVVIGETAVIGNNVKIYQGVTLGALSTKGGQALKGVRRHPTIEDNVTIYAGASILGGETIIGANSTVGSNVFITGSLPKNSKVTIKIPELLIKSTPAKEDAENESK